ncbi:dephospho-CoA kinase [Arthrobacter sp. L77]|uniref:dephospho-CoA kinase n=1 Tax=Arthrobacter sp. L77 TaxID=1496689 RepID=UPI00068B3404|nr:dephospho-CoA kinase [Arthrobacter sp. L77]
MLRIGLTGGIAAGKSVVARRLAELGAVLVDADVLARAAVEPGSAGLDAVVAAFGPEILGADGGLDRPALGRLVFADATARERLNAIVHPRVRAAAGALIEGAPQDAVIVEDIPLLVETGQAARFHLVVVVDAPDALRIERMVDHRGMGRDDAARRIAAQASRGDRLRAADAVLVNDRGVDELLAATDGLWRTRIVPFRDNLAAGRPADERPADGGAARPTAGLAGTSRLADRIRGKLDAALPPGCSVAPDEAPGGAPDGAPDQTSDRTRTGLPADVVRAALRVVVPPGGDIDAASDAVAGAGFPRDERIPGHGRTPSTTSHRAADPAIDVNVTVGPGPGAV